jgi:hypothetical protein
MGHRPRPNVKRAKHQIERAAYVPACPWCRHAVIAHDVRGGQRVCTRGHDEPSCRECRAIRNSVAGASLAFYTIAQILASPPSVRPAQLLFGKPVALTGAGVRPRS